MKVTFIHHSSYVVELKNKILIFDYVPKNSVSDSDDFRGSMPELPADKQIYFFASHVHKDHFNEEIFSYLKSHNAVYILSSDIKITREMKSKYGIGMAEKKQIHRIGAASTKEYGPKNDLVKVETLRSNEAGVAFFVETEGLRIYYAGDLNWWMWKESEMSGTMSGRDYRAALRSIENKHIDLAFIVLDGRLQEGTFTGSKYFIQHVRADLIFPMHMWRDYSLVQELKHDPEIVDLKDKIIDIDRENIVFDIPDER